ncbi:MAG TPA: CvpA family protein [Alphaproteobacteria bacterium]|nr:CvpA family protein [Alphaproteobacteria bacterium]
MLDPHFSGTDLIIVAIVLLSGLLAFMRGFLKETATLVAWIGGAAAVYVYLFSGADTHNWNYIARLPTSHLLIAGGIFIATVIVLSLLGRAVANMLDRESFGFFNRMLGFAYGLARGAFSICLLYAVAVWVIPIIKRDEPPPWLRDARTFPLIDYGGYTLANLWPGLVDSSERAPDKLMKSLDKSLDLPSSIGGDHNDGAYSDKERQKMDDLVEGVTKN